MENEIPARIGEMAEIHITEVLKYTLKGEFSHALLG
jgi:hypothetical protein